MKDAMLEIADCALSQYEGRSTRPVKGTLMVPLHPAVDVDDGGPISTVMNAIAFPLFPNFFFCHFSSPFL
jgi:hypothetical protein